MTTSPTWLERIRAAREHADEWLAHCDARHGTPGATMALLWQGLFDYLCVSSAQDLDELASLADTLRKLMTSYAQLRKLELDERQQTLREEAHYIKHHLSHAELTPDAPEILHSVERALSLL